MGGQRNSKLLRLIVGGVIVLVALYVLYGYQQASTDAAVKTRYLREAEEEYKALSKRFDMLSNELKGKINVRNGKSRRGEGESVGGLVKSGVK